ncbi:filamentous hemagglutinin N-terminal domain-containing protein [Kosakonia radicincitans]|uniref:hemagglutinin repeat-containing protein n=2 Tax=Kosakonia radicincitans TaxID=283686 RepID=UPI0011EBF7BB|nr:hemagglutinin repeat-containing protein [Kosakonia radicincitans]QEM92213.1 filamentous hemagglutinin N-terminal domain-containing protein [Kosakonia radicincitans]
MKTDKPVRFSQRAVSWLIISLLVWQPVAPAFAAAITPTGGASMDKAGNGVPVVNIATPNGAGISHNQFHDYNVGKEGLILNNATGQLTQTQLGGLIQNNPNLRAGQEAKGIINEVTGGSRSQLQGYTEVAGKAANVMVANPYGITCNGCGFINTPNATLTTGKPQFDAAGNLSALEVTRGTITVEGQGLNASGSDALALISRATEVNAAIHAKDLTVTTGANRVDASGKATAIAGEGAAPVVAVDTGALGGMYANRIHLVSTEKGVGVNLGNLTARQGDITLDANGKMVVKESIASGSLTAKGDSVTLSGSHKAGGDIAVTAAQDVALNHATLAADGKLTLSGAGNTTLAGSSLTSGGDMSLSGKQLTSDASTQANAAGNATLKAQTITHQGQLTTGGNAQITAVQLDNRGTVAAKGGLTASTTSLNNSGTLQGQTLGISGDSVQNNGTLAADGLLHVDAGTLTAGADSTITGKADVALTAQTRADLNGHVNADNSLAVTAGDLQTRQNAQLQSGGDMTLAASDATLNGTQAAKGTLSVGAKTLNHGGKSAATRITLGAPESLINSGTLVADTLDLGSSHISNSGLLQGTQALNLHTGLLDNLAGGTLYSAKDLTLAIPQLNNSGLVTTDGDLYLHGDALTSDGELNGVNLFSDYHSLSNNGRLLADGQLTLAADSIHNNGLVAANTTGVTADTLDNTGTLQGNDALTLQTQNTRNSGTLAGGNSLDLSGQALINSGLLAAKSLTLNSSDITNSGTLQGTSLLTATGSTLTNQQNGLLLSNGAVTLKNDRLSNAGQMQGGTLDLATGEWLNSGTALGQNGLNATVSGTLDNQGSVVSQQGMALTADSSNNSGTLMAKVLALHGDLRNSGLIQGTDGLNWQGTTLTGTADGQMLSGGSLTLQGTMLDNQGHMQGRNLTANADSWRNGGTVQAQDYLNATLGHSLDNQGQMLSQGGAAISAAQLTNDGKLAAKDLTVTAPDIASNGTLQGNDSLTIATQHLLNGGNGQLVSGSGLNLNLDSFNNQGLLYVQDGLTLTGNTLINGGSLESGALDATTGSLDNSGTLLAHNHATLQADQLANSGNLIADTLALTGTRITNSGLLQGTQQMQATADSIANTAGGRWLSGGGLTLNGNLNNDGTVQGDAITLRGDTLDNTGIINGLHGLTLNADTLTTASGSRTLSGGDFTLNAGQLSTQGTLQGGQVSVTADDWTLGGTLLSQGDLTATVGNTLNLPGALQSQGAMTLAAQTLNNDGQVLSAGDITLRGQQLINSGTVQGNTLTAHEAGITNNGALTGLNSLTLDNHQTTTALMARMAMATPQLALINSGSLLTQGALDITAGSVNNSGIWQGNSILLAAQSLDNSGAVQSAGALNFRLTGDLNSAAGSKITAMGTAALQALSLTNNGQWAAKNLTLNGGTLNNSGAISGSDGLTATLSGDVTQQSGGSLASNGALNLTAAALDNAGNVQGGDVTLAATTLTNRSGAQTVSAGTLTLTTPTLVNDGLLQGAGETRIDAITQAINEGKLLSGGQLTLTTPQYSGAGWLQASNLILNATNNNGSGMLLAGQMTLTGDTFTNQGTTQADNLTLNYRQFTNNGTLLGTNQLALNAAQVNQSASGRLFSGGDLFVGATGLDALGQVVALGNLTLQLANAFTGKTTLAAGKTLTVSSNGAIDNQSVMQGQAVNLSAGGQLTNNGQITTGSGASTLSGSNIVLNDNSAIQGGGDVALVSRGGITANGFAGTLGSLTLNAPGAIINTALLYAANNLALYANSITNQRGDMLAGNNLVLQRDAAGNANSEVINTSGSIETRNGDITIKTGHLLNQRDGLSVQQTTLQNSTVTPAPTIKVNAEDIPQYNILLQSWDVRTGGSNGPNGSGGSETYRRYIYEPSAAYTTRTLISSQVNTVVSSSGGAANIRAGRNFYGSADVFDNQASNVYASGNISLTGSSLNNASYQSGVLTTQYLYEFTRDSSVKYITLVPEVPPEVIGEGNNRRLKVYQGERHSKDDVTYLYFDYVGSDDNYDYYAQNLSVTKNEQITYSLKGQETIQQNGEIYRAVIQAGGNVSANFTSNISNTNTTANAGGVSGTITAPSLNTLSNQGIGGSVAKQALAAGPVAVNSPQWQDQLQNALQQINGGSGLDNGAASGAALATPGSQQKGNASLGNTGSLASAGVTTAALKNTGTTPQQGKTVDTSAYPLPTGNNGYFVVTDNPKSPYLITVNPKLDGLGQLDPALFGDLNKLLGITPTAAPRETSPTYTSETQFLGSSYMLGRLNLNPDYDYRFLGDAAFDTRYVSNALLNQTGSRYLNGMGSDLAQMQYLMDNAASAQQSLGLSFGVALTAEQIASLDHSILWWESATINGETVMIPKLYLSPKDVAVNNGSVIAGNNVSLDGGNVTNGGSTLLARNDLSVNSSGQITNSNDALLKAGGNVDLSAIGDISNISSTISGKTVALESVEGSINNLTLADQFALNTKNKSGSVGIRDTTLGSIASITATDGLSLVADKDITFTGATASAGGALLMDAGGNIAVNAIQKNEAYSQSGFRNRTDTSRSTVGYQGSSITAGGNLAMQAGNDLTLSASNVSAGKSAKLSAGNDLNLDAQQTSNASRSGKSENHSTGVDRTTVSAGDNLLLTAGRDINSQAAGLAAEQQVGMQAGRDVNLLAEATTQGDSYKASKKTVINEQVRQQGTEIASGTDTTIIAGRDMNAEAAQVTAQGDIGVQAGRDVNLTTATESDYHYKEETKTKKGFLKKTTTHTISEQSATREAGTLLSGDNVTVKSGNDLLVKGSAVVGDGDVTLSAAHNVDITAATNTDSNWQFKEKKKSGLMGSGGIGFTIGSSSTKQSLKEQGTTQSQSVSTIGSTGGNANIVAGEKAHISGADVIADKNLNVVAAEIIVDPGNDLLKRQERFEQKKSGLTLSVSSPVIDAAMAANNTLKRSQEVSDERLKTLYAVQAAKNAWVAASQAPSMAADIAQGNMNAVKVEVSVGSSKSSSESSSTQNQVRGSTLSAGGNTTLVATGANGSSGDLHISGSGVTGKNVTLVAQNNLLLDAASNNTEQTSKNSSSGWNVGVHLSLGQETGIGVSANGYQSKGTADGKSTEYVNTRVNASNELSLSSGGDTVISGAQALGEKITAEVGRNLTVTSLQDTDEYHSQQKSVSGGASFTFGSMTGSASLSINKSKTDSDYASVGQQSGLFAGDKGFDITVGDHTQLDGAVIASTATADKNLLDTGTLGWRDIDNKAQYSASSKGLSGGFSSGNNDKGERVNSGGVVPAISAASRGAASGTTQSAIAAGSIVIRAADQQVQDIAGLSRDTDSANGHIDKIFDEKKIAEQQELAAVFGQMANTAAGDIGEAMGWAADSPEKAAIHGVIGAIQASMGGGNALAGGLAGLSSEAFGQMVDTYLSNNTQLDRNERGAITQWAAALSGSAIGRMIGGSNGAQSGAAASLDAERYNRQLHPDEIARIQQLSDGDKEKEARLKAAACALVKCSAEFAEGSADYIKAQALEQLGNSDAYASERTQLASQSSNQLIYAMGSYTYASVPMFGYSLSDQTGDTLSRYNVGTRIGGLAQFTGGELQAVGGVAACTGGITCLAGSYLAASGLDTANAGWNAFLFGEDQKTSGAWLLEGLGVPPAYSEGIYGLTQVGAAGVGGVGSAGNAAIDDIINGSGQAVKPSGSAANTTTQLERKTTSGLTLVADPNKTTTILGTYNADTKEIINELRLPKSTDFGARNGEFNLLNTPDELYQNPIQFWDEYNKPWLDNVISRNDWIILATKPTNENLYRMNDATGKMEMTGFGREYNYLIDNGYTFDNKSMQMIKGK